MKKSVYDILGVSEKATDEDIKKAYRKLAMKYHPDRNPGDSTCEEKFKDVKEAYETIDTPDKRNTYDHGYSRGTSRDDEFYSEFFKEYDFTKNQSAEDILRELHRKSRQRQDWSLPNEHAFMDMTISLQEAFTGKQTTISYRVDGIQKQVLLNIPAGIDVGKTIRCAGAGSQTNKNLPAGDLYVKVIVETDSTFYREGSTLVIKKQIPLFDLITGTTVRITTIDNKEFDVAVRQGTKPGTRIRIPGYGMSILNSSSRGDLLVELDYEWPTSLSSDLVDYLKSIKD